MPTYKTYLFVSLLKALIFFASLTIFAQGEAPVSKYSDTIILNNQDRIIGEIKNMNNGVVLVKTNYSDKDLNLKWLDIIQVYTVQSFLVILSEGKRFNSNLVKSSVPGQVVLIKDQQEFEIRIDDIVYLRPVEKSFFSRFRGEVSIGFNFTKSENLKQLTVNSNFDYINRYLTLNAVYNSVISSQDNADYIKRINGNAGIKYFLKKEYFLVLSSDFLSNTEQKLNLRLATSFGFGKYFTRNNHTYFGGASGLVWNNESFSDMASTVNNSLEVFGTLELNIFDIKDFSLLTDLTIYPSITEEGRFRTDFSLDLKYDLPLDFFIKLGGSYNYDNKPVDGASEDDYVIQATFGWEKK